MSITGFDVVPNLPKYLVAVSMSYRTGIDVPKEVSATGMDVGLNLPRCLVPVLSSADVVPNSPKCPGPVVMCYRTSDVSGTGMIVIQNQTLRGVGYQC